jgi:hypothetical protein
MTTPTPQPPEADGTRANLLAVLDWAQAHINDSGTAPISIRIGHVSTSSNTVQRDTIQILNAPPAVLDVLYDWVRKSASIRNGILPFMDVRDGAITITT